MAPAKFAARAATPADWPGIEAVFVDWLSEYNPTGFQAEVDHRMQEVLPASLVVAVAVDPNGVVVGTATLRADLDPVLAEGVVAPVEITSVYVHRDAVGGGAGQAIVSFLEDEARARGFETVIVCSGPRNAKLGYPFWTRRYGEVVRTDPDHWAPGAERVVWRMSLV